MEVLRPHDAEDNEMNMEMRKILQRHLDKNNLEVATIEIYGESVVMITTEGREFQMNHADGCRFGTTNNQKHFWYMVERVNGKRVRVKKENW